MQRTLLASLSFVVALALPVLAQNPFKATAQLGVSARVGAIATVSGSKEVMEIGVTREVTLDSAQLALTFASRVESIVAKADEKLLILRGSLRNPEKTSSILLGPSEVIGLRLWERYTGPGEFQFIHHFDPDALEFVRATLKGGQSAKFIGVWRIPAAFSDFRLGIASGRPNIVAWYDLNALIQPLPPAQPEVAASQPFRLDGLEISKLSLSRPNRVAGSAVDPAKPVTVITLTATNRMLLPERWGWQYLTAELIAADGSVTKAYPSLYDPSTSAAWAGDLPAGESVTSQFLFYPARPSAPKTLRLTMLATGRRVDVDLSK